MALTQDLFDEILIALVEYRITRAKIRMTELHEEITFEETPDFMRAFDKYWTLITTAYETADPQHIPRVFSSATRVNLGIPEIQSFDSWVVMRCIALQLIPFDINLVANQLNLSFETNFAFSLVALNPDQELKITYMLKDTSSVVNTGLFSVLTKPGHQEHCILDAVQRNAPMN